MQGQAIGFDRESKLFVIRRSDGKMVGFDLEVVPSDILPGDDVSWQQDEYGFAIGGPVKVAKIAA